MKFFIKCHSAMDQTFIGPFQYKKDALIFLRQHGNPEHDSWILDRTEMIRDIKTYGKITIQSPEAFDHDSR